MLVQQATHDVSRTRLVDTDDDRRLRIARHGRCADADRSRFAVAPATVDDRFDVVARDERDDALGVATQHDFDHLDAGRL